MAEDKKDEQVQKQEGAKPVEAPIVAVAAVKEEKAVVAKTEKPANCVGCKKSIKKKRWYYRNGAYYCTKRCWSTTTKKPVKAEEAPAVS